MQEADEVVTVDVTPRALLHRLERGVVYAPDKAAQALEEERRRDMRLPQPVQPQDSGRQERILSWLTPHSSTAMLIVARDTSISELSPADRAALERHMNFCRNLRIEPAVIESSEPAKAVVAYARKHGVTQIFVERETPEVRRRAGSANLHSPAPVENWKTIPHVPLISSRRPGTVIGSAPRNNPAHTYLMCLSFVSQMKWPPQYSVWNNRLPATVRKSGNSGRIFTVRGFTASFFSSIIIRILAAI